MGALLIALLVQVVAAQDTVDETAELQPISREVAGQLETDSVGYLPVDSLLCNEIADTLLFEPFLAPDENLNDIFSEKMDSLMNSWYIQHFFHPGEPTELSDSYPVNLPDSVYISRLQDIQQVIDLPYNNVVRNLIILYTEKRRDLVEVMLGLSAYYFPLFEETLDRYNMPLELKYLPVIESALNPKALSRAGANGLWQFMYGTGKQFGLDITSFVDERRDPFKSTDAAARYLQQLYRIYDDWFLAIAAYNCGPGNLNRAIQRSGNKRNYWEIYYRLPRETRGYVPAYIAAVYVMNYYREHNLQPRMPDIAIQTDTVVVHDYLHFNQLEAKLNIDKEELRTLNPMFRRDVIPAKPDKPYPIVLPYEKIKTFIELDTALFAYDREKYFPDNTLANPAAASSTYFTPVDVEGKAKIVYTVKSGDNVGYISSWFNVRTADLRYWNNIQRNLIRVGQKLIIYVPEEQKDKYERVNTLTFAQKQASIGKTTGSSGITRQENPPDPNYEYYTVRNGDTLWEIARQFAGTSAEEIIKLNNLSNGARLSVGQRLKIKLKGSS